MSKPTLYGHPISPYVRKARLVLLFHDIDFEHEMVTPHADHPGFRKASPLGRIPAFRDEAVAFADSSVIAHYICKFHGDNAMLPQDAAGFTRTLWFEEYADSVMTPAIAAHLFAEVVLAGRLFPREPIQADIDKALNQELPKIYAFLDAELQGREWLVTDAPTIADLAVGGLLIALYHCGQEIPESAPALGAYAERFFDLPLIQQVIAQEVEVLRGIGYDSPLAARVGRA